MSVPAKCQRTGNEIQLEDGFFVASPFIGDWEFVSRDAPENHGDYNIAVKDLVKSPGALVDWFAHLREKTWFNPDQFFDFFKKFRNENGLYGCL